MVGCEALCILFLRGLVAELVLLCDRSKWQILVGEGRLGDICSNETRARILQKAFDPRKNRISSNCLLYSIRIYD